MLVDNLPLPTPHDPAEDPPGSIDPLGTVASAERLARILRPRPGNSSPQTRYRRRPNRPSPPQLAKVGAYCAGKWMCRQLAVNLHVDVPDPHEGSAFGNFVTGAFDRAKTLVEFRGSGMAVDVGGRAMRKLHEYVKIAEAAEILGVCENTLRKWVDERRIPASVNPANGYRLFRREDLDTFLTKASQPASTTRRPR